MIWFGADPGGHGRFAVAILREDGSFHTDVLSHADEAIDWLKQEPKAAGIDAPMWWSSGKSSDRKADRFLRQQYKIKAGTVQTANSLRGAVLIQGVMLAIRLRERYPSLPITETHPKALLKALKLNRSELAERFDLKRNLPATEHEQDALLGAVAAREGFLERWTRNLASERNSSEQDPAQLPASPIVYWWPDV